MSFKPTGLALGALALVAAATWSGTSQAGIVLQDNFNSDSPMLNWTGDSVFSSVVPPGSVGVPSTDLIGTGPNGTSYDVDAGQGFGYYVDLDGSTGNNNAPSGVLESLQDIAAGTYTLSFNLGGNARGYPPVETTFVTLGDFSATIGPLASNSPLSDVYTYTFLTTGGNLYIGDSGPSNQQGNILDNVLLVDGSLAATPLPSTWSMFLIAFIGLGSLAYRGTTRGSAFASA